MTDLMYKLFRYLPRITALVSVALVTSFGSISSAVHAQTLDEQLETIFSEPITPTAPTSSPRTDPLPTITEPQPESRAPASPLFRGPVGASDRVFSGPVDPDTEDNPSLSRRARGEGSRTDLPRQDGVIIPGRRDNGATRTTIGTVRPNDPNTQAVEDPNALIQQPPRIRIDGDLDRDLDADLRDTFDDDLVLRDDLLTQVPLTGRTTGAAALLRNSRAPNTGFTAPARQAFPSIDQERPFDPVGLRLGVFDIFPTLSATTVVTDNVFEDAGPTESDIGLELASTVAIQSDWNRHALGLNFRGTTVFFNEFDSENTTDISIVANGRLDLTLRSNIELDAGYQLSSDQRGSTDSTTGAVSEPDEETIQLGATFNNRFNRLVNRTRIGYVTEINGDAELVGGGVDLGADEDFSQIDISSRWTYEFSPSFAAFVEGAYNRQSFDAVADSDGILRDAQGYEGRIGTIVELGVATRAEISVGYTTRINDVSQLGNVEGVVLGADILWRPSALTSVNLTTETDLNTTTLVGSLGSIEQQTNLNIRHEFRRFAIGTLGLGWRHEDFSGSTVTENEFLFRLGGEYLFSRNVVALASYEYTDFNTSAPNGDYVANEFRLGIQVRR